MILNIKRKFVNSKLNIIIIKLGTIQTITKFGSYLVNKMYLFHFNVYNSNDLSRDKIPTWPEINCYNNDIVIIIIFIKKAPRAGNIVTE